MTWSRVAGPTTGSWPGRSQAMSSLVRSGIEHRDRRAVAAGAQVRRHERLREAQPRSGDEPLAQADVARRTHDPVRLGRRPLEDEPRVTAIQRGQRRARPAVVRERDFGDAGQPVPFEELSERPRRLRPSARRRHVVGPIGTAVEIDDVRIGAVPRQHDDQRLGRRRVGLDVDLAGRDVDEVAGPRRHRLLDAGRAPGVVGGAGQDVDRGLAVAVVVDPGLGRPARSRRSTNRAARSRRVGFEIAIERSMPGCWPTVV